MASGIVDSSTFEALPVVATSTTKMITTISTLLSTSSSKNQSNSNNSNLPTIKDNSRFALAFDLNLGSINLDLLDNDKPESFIKLAPILIRQAFKYWKIKHNTLKQNIVDFKTPKISSNRHLFWMLHKLHGLRKFKKQVTKFHGQKRGEKGQFHYVN